MDNKQLATEQEALQQAARQLNDAILAHTIALSDIHEEHLITLPLPRDDGGDTVLIHYYHSLNLLPHGTLISMNYATYQITPDGVVCVNDRLGIPVTNKTATPLSTFWDEMVTCYAYQIDNPDILPHITYMPDTNM